MKRTRPAHAYVVAVLFGLLSVAIQSAHADVDALDNVPSATLLFPYFEVDLGSGTGHTTVLSWHAVSATATLTHVTVWTDLGVPVLTFNVYLTGYDVAAIDLRDVLVSGNLPSTASAGQDPSDQISPKGAKSQDINFASCTGQLPYATPALTTSYLSDLRSALTGGPAVFLSGKCSGYNHHDQIARGYVTVDAVTNCTARSPADPGYFAGGSGDVADQGGFGYANITGEYFLFDVAHNLVHQDSAVGLEGVNPSLETRTSTSGNYTFYGRLVNWSASDNREPLPNTWAIDAQAAGMELIVWRDIKIAPTTFTCGPAVPPSMGLPLGQETAFSFDNQEQPLSIPAGTPFGLATQRVALGTSAFPLPTKPGWVYLGLGYQNTVVPGANATADVKADQAYVTVLQYPESHATSTGASAIALDSGQAAQHTHPAD